LGPAVDARRVSLIALRGEGARATLNGAFKYPLSSGFLIGSLTKGLSNELGSAGGEVIAESGVLLVSVSPLSDEGFVRPAEVF
jgi:hypothetical protein